MTNLEQRIRDLLDEEARSAPSPHGTAPVVRRTRHRQAVTLAASAFGVIALVAASIVGVRAVLSTGRGTPADAPTVTTTMNGISITYPEGWHLIDPDEAGLNGPDVEPAPGFPRIVIALSPVATAEQFGCPGMAEGTMPSFLMTVQEEPRALAGPDAVAWPVELEPMDVGDAESACYPDWEFLRAGWTAAGRTFEARLGVAPEIGEEDRLALFDAFSSMTFKSGGTPASSVVLATGTAGGEEWQLLASRQADGLSLSLQAESGGRGAGGFDLSSSSLIIYDVILGEGDRAERILFAALPPEVVRVGLSVLADDELIVRFLDVPDEVDPGMNAFVQQLPAGYSVAVNAYDQAGEIVAAGEVYSEVLDLTQLGSMPDEVLPEHGGTSWGLYLALGESIDDSTIELASREAEELGYSPSVGDLACDEGASEAFDATPSVSSRVAVYFATHFDAMAALMYAHELLGIEPPGIARVTTLCLD